jgi:hypothetical protein
MRPLAESERIPKRTALEHTLRLLRGRLLIFRDKVRGGQNSPRPE